MLYLCPFWIYTRSLPRNAQFIGCSMQKLTRIRYPHSSPPWDAISRPGIFTSGYPYSQANTALQAEVLTYRVPSECMRLWIILQFTRPAFRRHLILYEWSLNSKVRANKSFDLDPTRVSRRPQAGLVAVDTNPKLVRQLLE